MESDSNRRLNIPCGTVCVYVCVCVWSVYYVISHVLFCFYVLLRCVDFIRIVNCNHHHHVYKYPMMCYYDSRIQTPTYIGTYIYIQAEAMCLCLIRHLAFILILTCVMYQIYNHMFEMHIQNICDCTIAHRD